LIESDTLTTAVRDLYEMNNSLRGFTIYSGSKLQKNSRYVIIQTMRIYSNSNSVIECISPKPHENSCIQSH